jgi:hypothetical protein
MPKSRKPFSLQLKRPKFCHFLGLKAVWRKNYDYKPQFVLEILKAVYLSVDWVPKLIQKFFPTMEQKLVQRCETEIVADACNASINLEGLDALRSLEPSMRTSVILILVFSWNSAIVWKVTWYSRDRRHGCLHTCLHLYWPDSAQPELGTVRMGLDIP